MGRSAQAQEVISRLHWESADHSKSVEEIQNLVNIGEAELLGQVGVQERPVYLVHGTVVYERSIDFGTTQRSFYKVDYRRSKELLERFRSNGN